MTTVYKAAVFSCLPCATFLGKILLFHISPAWHQVVPNLFPLGPPVAGEVECGKNARVEDLHRLSTGLAVRPQGRFLGIFQKLSYLNRFKIKKALCLSHEPKHSQKSSCFISVVEGTYSRETPASRSFLLNLPGNEIVNRPGVTNRSGR